MKTDFLIIGQGIAGTLLSYRLLQAGKKVMVIDNGAPHKASLVAGAVINPLSGKKWTATPDAALFLPEAIACYQELEVLLQQRLLQQLPLYVYSNEGPFTGLEPCSSKEQEALAHFFYPGTSLYRSITTWLVDSATLLDHWRQYLQQQAAYRQEVFRMENCFISEAGVRYHDIEAEKIVFCDGATGAGNPWCTGLPFTANRGEALLLHIPGLPADALYHRQLRLVPRKDGLFWCGSNYQWNFTDLNPDAAWRADAITRLKQWLKLPFELADHLVAERPTTAGQIPLVGLHPRMSSVAIFNGLGTRGFSSGPFWAGELVCKLQDPQYLIRNYSEDWFAGKFL